MPKGGCESPKYSLCIPHRVQYPYSRPTTHHRLGGIDPEICPPSWTPNIFRGTCFLGCRVQGSGALRFRAPGPGIIKGYKEGPLEGTLNLISLNSPHISPLYVPYIVPLHLSSPQVTPKVPSKGPSFRLLIITEVRSCF